MSRGRRNCNPGNIRLSPSGVSYVGEVIPSRDRAFRTFRSMKWGYRAIFVLLHTYYLRYGLNTIEDFIQRWAPPVENHTEHYIRAVEQRTGLRRGEPLSTLCREQMIPLAAAISAVENGCEAASEEVAAGWELFFADFGETV